MPYHRDVALWQFRKYKNEGDISALGEQKSEHPLGRAICIVYADQNGKPEEGADFRMAVEKSISGGELCLRVLSSRGQANFQQIMAEMKAKYQRVE